MRRILGGALFLFPLTGALAAAATAETQAGADGRELYLARCGGCHLEGGFGTRVLERRVVEGQAMLERRETLPAVMVVSAVRLGIGSMPQMRPAEISDADLAAIAQYLENPS